MKFLKITPSTEWAWDELWMEHFGTFAIVYVCGLAVMMSDLGKLDLTGVALANFMVYSFMIWAGAQISGANYNGAVTIALMITRNIGVVKGLLYLLAQFSGSIMGGLILGGFIKMYTRDPLIFKNLLGYPHCDLARFGIGPCIITELIGTFFLVFMFYATAVSMKPPTEKTAKEQLAHKYAKPTSHSFALAIGGMLGIAVLTIGPITGAALNPWRVLGPAIVSRELFKAHYWYAFVYYLICPAAGALAGGAAYLIFMRDEGQFDDDSEENVRLNVNGDAAGTDDVENNQANNT